MFLGNYYSMLVYCFKQKYIHAFFTNVFGVFHLTIEAMMACLVMCMDTASIHLNRCNELELLIKENMVMKPKQCW